MMVVVVVCDTEDREAPRLIYSQGSHKSEYLPSADCLRLSALDEVRYTPDETMRCVVGAGEVARLGREGRLAALGGTRGCLLRPIDVGG